MSELSVTCEFSNVMGGDELWVVCVDVLDGEDEGDSEGTAFALVEEGNEDAVIEFT